MLTHKQERLLRAKEETRRTEMLEDEQLPSKTDKKPVPANAAIDVRARCGMQFDKYDLDKDGEIEMIEALRAMKDLLGPLAKDFVSEYVKIDGDGSGYLNKEEFYDLYVALAKLGGKTPEEALSAAALRGMTWA